MNSSFQRGNGRGKPETAVDRHDDSENVTDWRVTELRAFGKLSILSKFKIPRNILTLDGERQSFFTRKRRKQVQRGNLARQIEHEFIQDSSWRPFDVMTRCQPVAR